MPDAWPYSNYLDWVGDRAGTLVDQDFVLEQFGGADCYRQEMNEFLIDSAFNVED